MPDTTTPSTYSQDVRNCFAHKIGAAGLDEQSFRDYVGRTAASLKRLRAAMQDNSLPILNLPKRDDEMRAMTAAAARHRGLGHVIVLGTGGSSLKWPTVTALADGGLGSAGRLAGRPLLWFIENVDPWGFAKTVDSVDPTSTGLVIISKSGRHRRDLVAGAGAAAAHREGRRPRQAARTHHRHHRAERQSVAPAGAALRPPTDRPRSECRQSLLGAVADRDAADDSRRLRDRRTGSRRRAGSARRGTRSRLGTRPAVGAALNIALAERRGATQTGRHAVYRPAGTFGLWFRQLWAESLGKDGKGTTPIRAQGAVDQHSRLQLYLSGPKDKLYTIIMGEARGIGPRYAREQLNDKALDWLAGRTMGDLLDVSQRATAETLARNGRPVRIMRVPNLDERSMGALLMHFMLETIIAADLLGIDPFDQPAVEEGKKLARQYLAEMG